MADFGVSAVGFKIKRLEDIVNEMNTLLLQVEDPATGEKLQSQLNEDDPVMQLSNIVCDANAALWEIAQAVYNQFNPMLATGASLSGLVQLNGIQRKMGTPSSVEITVMGKPNTSVDSSFTVSDQNNTIQWKAVSDFLIGEDGQAKIMCNSTINGIFPYAAGTINTVVTPVSAITSVINEGPTILGTTDESDTSLRIRRRQSTAAPSQSTSEAIWTAINNIPGVKYVFIAVNNTLEPDDRGIPAKSVAAVVMGGDDQEIAKALFNRMPVACYTYGTTSIQFVDSLQGVTTIQFSRPTEIPIYVNVNVSIIDANAAPADYVTQIKNNIVLFSQGGMSSLGIPPEDGFDDYGFLPNTDVVYSRLYSPVNIIPGLKINSLTIGKSSSSLSTADVIIDWNQIALFTIDNIQVTVV